ncbi:MAG TPA: Glu-tRNA(Gln) amidotransferase subunit GatE [Candidatus Aminicenantes bacterium]|nr:Glu-tRNA(Gln) amidotransferase subunit GatE [Candidatus Aminicenantes bacterium]
MSENPRPDQNTRKTLKQVGYKPLGKIPDAVYAEMGFRCGLEIHQQLMTRQKLFCRCPAGIYQKDGEYDAELVRHMRPTLSELGEYDGTALMEFKTRKNIYYRIQNETACTYDIDDTPPFRIDDQALDIALEVALLLETSIVGELHVTRKQYLDGSIPTGFQRTAIVGIEGRIPVQGSEVGIIQISVEEDSCREVSDLGHDRVYTTDRLGMPLIETVTHPHLVTPRMAAAGAQYLRFMTRSTGHVRTGIGAAREDVNVSIRGGTRVEIKGVAHISWIPELTHIEAFRQKSLLHIRSLLSERGMNADAWKVTSVDLPETWIPHKSLHELYRGARDLRAVALNLPGFKNLLSHFTQPGQVFADEIADRLKVVACIERPNMVHSEESRSLLERSQLAEIRRRLEGGPQDAQVVVWGPADDIPTAVETVEERCRMAFAGVPNETRKSYPDGTTRFERVLPGPDRMYPDTDTAPIPVEEERIERIRAGLPEPVSGQMARMREWNVAPNHVGYILRGNLFGILERIVKKFKQPPRRVARVLSQVLRNLAPVPHGKGGFDPARLVDIYAFMKREEIDTALVEAMLPVVTEHPQMELPSVLETIGFKTKKRQEILDLLPVLHAKFSQINTSPDPMARHRWIMGQLRPVALGNIDLKELSRLVPGDQDE